MKNISMFLVAMLGGCATMPLNEPVSVGERNAAFSYIPLDPLPVRIENAKACVGTINNAKALLDALPDNAVRVSVKQVSGKGGATFGPATLGTEGSQYEVILDYISADTANIRFNIGTVSRDSQGAVDSIKPFAGGIPEGAELFVQRAPDNFTTSSGPGEVVIPVYVGVGLRLTASVNVLKGNVNLASLGAIAASVEAGRSSGSLVVQTLGINGKQVAASLPLPSELNSTTVQNAIQSLGSIKAVMYDAENTRLAPRVTGIYNPLQTSDPRLINAIVSQLAKEHIPWSPPCIGVGSTTQASK